MVDISSYPAHVQEAIQLVNLAEDAAERVKKGVRWLDEHAPPGWRLEMISIADGKVTCWVRMARNDQNPLALAFRRVAGYQGLDGRATWATVAPQLEFGENSYSAENKGFIEKTHFVSNAAIIPSDIDGMFLNEAWATVLKNFEWTACVNMTWYPLSHEHNGRDVRGWFYPKWLARSISRLRAA